MTVENVTRRLAAILSADVKDYSLLMRADEAETVRTLTSYRELISTLIRQYRGRVVDSPGDNLLAEFASVVDAVQGAVAIQKELEAQNGELPVDRRMIYRIGINLGDVIVEGDRIYGDGVNIAARLEGLADPGGICISRTAFDQIEDKLPFGYEYLGEKPVKNISKPVSAYRVVLKPGEKSVGDRLKKRPVKLGPEKSAASKDQIEKKRIEQRLKRRTHFLRHLRTYFIIIGFLFVINLLTYNGVLWFIWPAMGWGVAILLHWNFGGRSPSGRGSKEE